MTEAHATLENRTFDEIAVGDSAGVTKTLTRDEIALFTAVSGDINPIHLDERRAEASPLRRVVGHSLLGGGGGLISALLGTRLPGPGTAYVVQELHFLRARRRARALHPPDQPSEESDYADARSSEHADLLARIAALSASAP